MATLESRVSRLEDAYDNLATKEDLADLETRMATKEDLANLETRMATKEDLEQLATKSEVEQLATKSEVEQLATKSEVEQLRVDIGPLKAAHARNEATMETPLIAQDMGFKLARVLELQERMELTAGQDLSDISRGDLRSFHRADLIMQVTDPQGQESYIAVEISYTADHRDTTRAIRNAEYLERFTGCPARAAIAGLRRDRRIEDIESDDVFWYELPDTIIEVD